MQAQSGRSEKEKLCVIKYKDLYSNNNYKTVFSLLSVNNEKNINHIELLVKYKLSSQNINDKYLLTFSQPEIYGDVFFREFNFDTLFIPDEVKILYKKAEDNDVLNIGSLKFPGETALPLQDSVLNDNYIEIIPEISYKRLKEIIKKAEDVNYYYGYVTVMNEMFNKLNKDKEGMDIVGDYELIHRIVSNINELDLINSLNLKKHDPADFLPVFEKYKLLERRKRTLSKQFLTNNTSLDSSDTEKFGKNLIDISTYFLQERKQHRLFLSHTYEQMAELKTDTTVCSLMRSSYVGDRKYMPYGKVKVFNMFIKTADIYFKTENYNDALLMLNNAINWSLISGMQFPESTIKPHLEKVVDGVLSSYLQIAYASLKRGNSEMTRQYLTKAKTELYKFNNSYPYIDAPLLFNTKNSLINIIKYYTYSKKYDKALNVFKLFQPLDFNGKTDKIIIAKTYAGIYNNFLNKINSDIYNKQYDKAYQNIITLRKFLSESLNYLTLSEKQILETKHAVNFLYKHYLIKSRTAQNKNTVNFKNIYFNKAITLKNKFNI